MKPSSDIDLFTTTLPVPVLVFGTVFLRRTFAGCHRVLRVMTLRPPESHRGSPSWLVCPGDHAVYHGGPAGTSFRHARCADWNTGELGLVPTGICMLMPVALTTGSAMPGRPWERIQATNFSA